MLVLKKKVYLQKMKGREKATEAKTKNEETDEGCPFGQHFDGDIWVIFRKASTAGEIEAVKIKEARKPLPDIDTLEEIVHRA